MLKLQNKKQIKYISPTQDMQLKEMVTTFKILKLKKDIFQYPIKI